MKTRDELVEDATVAVFAALVNAHEIRDVAWEADRLAERAKDCAEVLVGELRAPEPTVEVPGLPGPSEELKPELERLREPEQAGVATIGSYGQDGVGKTSVVQAPGPACLPCAARPPAPEVETGLEP